MSEIEIGRAKRGRRAYSFDDIAIVPSRRTRDPEEVSVAWQIDAYRFEIPIVAAPMDSVMSPETAVAFGKHGGLGVLDLEGLWTRYDDPTDLLAEVSGLRGQAATQRMQEIYAEPIKPDLITARIGVDLLHPFRGGSGIQRDDLGEQRLGIVVPRPQPLEVQHPEAAVLAEGGRELR